MSFVYEDLFGGGRLRKTLDSEGRVNEEVHLRPDGSRYESKTYQYWPSGQMKSLEVTRHSVDEKQRTRIVFDRAGNETERTGFDTHGNVLFRQVTTYSPDNGGQRIETDSFDARGILTEHKSTKLNDRGDLTEEVWLDPTGNLIECQNWEYDYKNGSVMYRRYASDGKEVESRTTKFTPFD